MPFGIDFWTNFGRLGLPKWSQVGTKIGSKIDVNVDWRFFKIRALAAAGARFFRFRGSKLRAQIDEKSIKKRLPRRSASWHRFFSDFGRFWVPSWGGKSIKNRSKMASKKQWKKEEHRNCLKIASRGPGTARGWGSRPMGGGKGEG